MTSDRSGKILPLVGRRQTPGVRKRLYLENSIAGALGQDDLLEGLVELAATTQLRQGRANAELKAFAQVVELGLRELQGLVRAQHGYLGAAWSAGEQAGGVSEEAS